ncbi:50S ribosomal protein L24 [Acetilactobacillus jinshanensis]|uniref:Large ribosomal subunit protein uL24 n=1 Tax=Acetilactobacillus jinshanensis TaxID=1720083 RepID=A0A4P6ZJN4_9LACO|nr:50S ribosomal protein L24 [Acetilactobacillus jinshanensis]QBP17834.1 50S ribosomal protein L24 [Acetilactobacillus jinshanensis]URL60695.1 50S ribosomal protein L24 [uncultured bacterium]
MFVKTGDKVRVIAGKDKGKEGTVLSVLSDANRVIVKGINVVKKAEKASQSNPQGGIKSVEAPLNASNVMVIDPSTKKPTRIGYKFENGKKIRVSKKTKKPIK